MSIISSEAKWAVLQRVVRLSIEEIRGTTKGKEYEAGFIAGATRRPTNEEIEAGAKRLLWDSCEWDGVDSYAAKDEEDAWDYAGRFPRWQEDYIRQAKELLALARKAVNE